MYSARVQEYKAPLNGTLAESGLEWWLWALPVWKGISTIPRSSLLLSQTNILERVRVISGMAHWNVLNDSFN